MIAMTHQQASRGNSHMNQYEELNGVSMTNGGINGSGSGAGTTGVTNSTSGVGVTGTNQNTENSAKSVQEAPHREDNLKSQSRRIGSAAKTVGSSSENAVAEKHVIDDDTEEEEEEEDEDEDEEDHIEEDEEEDEQVVRELRREGNISNGTTRMSTTNEMGQELAGRETARGPSSAIPMSIGVGMPSVETGEFSGGNVATGGGMGGYWRQSRPSSPRMPPPEQPESRPKSRHDSIANSTITTTTRYNNLGYWRARRVTFYKNGDPYFPGVEFR